MPSYEFWQAAMRGEKPKMFNEQPELGFYRKGISERNDKGNNRRVGWTPVAIFMVHNELFAAVGDVTITDREKINDLWAWVAGNPISEDWYRAVAEMGNPWPDELAAKTEVPTANRVITKDDNAPPEASPEVEHATAIDTAISAAIKKVTSEAEAAQALGSRNRIAELRLAADKAGKALYEPPYQAYKALYATWNPMVKRAEVAEKALTTAILTFRESERKRLAKIEADRIEEQRKIDEANERAAQRAIAQGEPEPMPEPLPEAPQAEPAPLPVVPTYGTRKLKEEVKRILETVTDFDAVYAFLKDEPKVKALLTDLAAAKIKAGFTVPGTVTREGLI